MRKLYILCLIVLSSIVVSSAWADQMTFTTYYPAPYGVYNDMRVMNSLGVGTMDPGTAQLAVIGGNVGIGTTNPQATLEVDNTLRLTPVDPSSVTGQTGMLICDNSGNILRWDPNTSNWVSIGGGVAIAVNSKTISNSGTQNFTLDVLLNNPTNGAAFITTIHDRGTFDFNDEITITKSILSDRVRFNIKVRCDLELVITGIAWR